MVLVLSVFGVLLEIGEPVYRIRGMDLWVTLAFSASLDASIPDSSMSHAALCISLFIFYFFQDILDWHRTFGPVFFFFL